jgi:hypothetical protein
MDSTHAAPISYTTVNLISGASSVSRTRNSSRVTRCVLNACEDVVSPGGSYVSSLLSYEPPARP